jgi:hypothetical protein
MLAIPLALGLALAPHEGAGAPPAVGETLTEPAPSTALGDDARAIEGRDGSADRRSTTAVADASPAPADSARRQAAGEKNEFIQVLRATLRVTRVLVNVLLELLDRGLELIA